MFRFAKEDRRKQRTREGNERARASASTVYDVDLSATDVELSTTGGRCDVKSDLFTAEEILAVTDVQGLLASKFNLY